MKEGIHKVVKSVASPLHFFALVIIAIVLVVGFLAWKSSLSAEITAKAIYLCLFICINLIGLVSYLTIKHLISDLNLYL